MSKFKKNDNVVFYRNNLIKNSTAIVCGVVETNESPTFYIMENEEFGWSPSTKQIEDFSLDSNKKYIFASELELST